MDGDNEACTSSQSTVSLAPKTIRVLETDVSRQICTSQVITSAAGAIRQMIDNCVDAGAKAIEVTTENFGADLIRVSDDGCGIEEASFETLCKPHATSKLTDYTDLLSLSTLGFRGEALNALCALGSVTICTRTASMDSGQKLHFDSSGNIVKRDTVPREVGTTVEVRELFMPLPVRRKELERTAKRDYARLLAVVQEFALSRPSVRFNVFSLTGNGKRHHALTTSGGLSSLSDVIYNLFGGRADKNAMIALDTVEADEESKVNYGIHGEEAEGEVQRFILDGFTSSPEHGQGRPTGERQFVFINGRPVDYPKVCRAVNEVYQQYNRRQYPALVLRIEMPSEWVDVNVTPDKRLVFCQKEKALLCAVRSSLVAAFKPFEGLIGAVDGGRVKAEVVLSQSFANQSMNESRDKSEKRRERIEEHEKDDSMMDRSAVSTMSEAERMNSLLDSLHDEEWRRADGERRGGKRKDRQTDTTQGTQTHTPAGFTSRLVCMPTAKKAKTTEAGIRTLDSFAFKLIPHTSSQSLQQPNDGPATTESDTITEVVGTVGRDSNGGERPSSQEDKLDRGLLIALAEREEEDRLQRHEEWMETLQSKDREDAQRIRWTDGVKVEVHSQRVKNEVISQVERGDEDKEEDDEELTMSQEIEKEVAISWEQMDRIEQKIETTVDDIMGLRVSIEEEAEEGRLDCLSTVDNEDEEEAERELRRALKRSDFEEMEVIGQFNDGFIITRLSSHLFIVDQHASDEKFNFERLEKTAVVKNQETIVPQRLDVGAVQESVIRDNLSIFRASGFDFRFPEDGSCAELLALPSLQGIQFDRSDIDELISTLSLLPGVMCRPTKLRKIFASKACRKSVMIGTRLDKEKQATIVRQLGGLDNPWCCPHGRPTLRHLVDLNKLKKE